MPIYVHDFTTKILILNQIKIDIGKYRDAIKKNSVMCKRL